jgi:thiamine pyrophosphokinase
VSAGGIVALILADGEVPTRARLDTAWPGWDAGVTLVIAADGGARHAIAFGRAIAVWVGDGDSIDPGDLAALAATGVDIRRADPNKDESDTELAVLAAVDAGADEVIVLGALGGIRVDHALANLGLLEHPALAHRRLWIYDERASRISLIAAPDASGRAVAAVREGHAGDLVSLVPSGMSAVGVTTDGLRYPLRDEPLILGRTRGVSNVRTTAVARITLRSGRLLVIETPATVGP